MTSPIHPCGPVPRGSSTAPGIVPPISPLVVRRLEPSLIDARTFPVTPNEMKSCDGEPLAAVSASNASGPPAAPDAPPRAWPIARASSSPASVSRRS